MRAWSLLRGHATAGRTGARPPGRLRRLRAAAVVVVTAGTLLALAAPASAHIENPGSFTFSESGAVLRVGLLQVPLPAGSMAGQIDADGNITIPDSALAITDQPLSQNLNAGIGTVSVSGTATVQTSGLTGTLDPGSGAASLDTSLFASATFTATATLIDGSQAAYSGTCTIGGSAPADQLPVTLTTDPPGVPYSEQTAYLSWCRSQARSPSCRPMGVRSR